MPIEDLKIDKYTLDNLLAEIHSNQSDIMELRKSVIKMEYKQDRLIEGQYKLHAAISVAAKTALQATSKMEEIKDPW